MSFTNRRGRKAKSVPQEGSEYARIEKDTRDGSRDYLIPRTEARRLFDEGKLDQDLTNSKTWFVYIERREVGDVRGIRRTCQPS